MAIPGTIPLSGTLAPFGLTDTYPITDAVYGIDGLRNVADNIERNAIPDERRREGMLVGTLDSGNYWRLKVAPWTGLDTDWEPFSSGGTGNKKIISVGETITIPVGYQYLIYGDLTVDGTLNIEGELTLINGAVVVGVGIVNNTGTIVLVGLEPISKKYKASFSSTANVPFTITHNLNTLDFVYQAREGNDDISVDLVRLNTTQVQVTTSANIVGSITFVAF